MLKWIGEQDHLKSDELMRCTITDYISKHHNTGVDGHGFFGGKGRDKDGLAVQYQLCEE